MAYPLRESISLDGMDLTLYQFSAAGKRQSGSSVDQETNTVQVTGEPVDVSEEPLVMDTFHLGFGYSWRLLSGTYAWAENADCRFPRLVLPGPHVTSTVLAGLTMSPRCGQDYNGHFYFGVGNQIWRVPGGTGTPVLDNTLTAGLVAWSMDTFLGNLYVGTSTSTNSLAAPGPLYQNAAGTWTGGGPNRKAIAHAWYQAAASGTFGSLAIDRLGHGLERQQRGHCAHGCRQLGRVDQRRRHDLRHQQPGVGPGAYLRGQDQRAARRRRRRQVSRRT